MTVAIVHYHLGPGGVSRVILAASRVLAEYGVPHVILVGSAPGEPPSGLPLRLVPALDYGAQATGDPAGLLREAACAELGGPPDVWHFHNHSLGKNPWIADAVARLAEDGERLVLQLHDLAEDGRPRNYQNIAGQRHLYPVSPSIRYAFLNRKDRDTFVRAGLPAEHADLIVNPVSLPACVVMDERSAPLVFAPVRGIRRKNPGELVFLSALAPPGARFAMSRAPLDPEALALHDTWNRFAERHRLPIGFDVVDHFTPSAGSGSDFESWITHATHFASTSVAEGFGLPFLEAIAHGKPIIGRRLPHIAEEHARHGIQAGDLYDRLLIPVDWVDTPILKEHLTTTLARNHRAYGLQLTRDTITATYDLLVRDGLLDFGNLPEPLQQGAIERVADPDCRQVPLVETDGETRSASDWLRDALASRKPAATPGELTAFSPDAYGKSITALYDSLMKSGGDTVRHLAPERILSAYLSPASFHFLRSAAPPCASRDRVRAVVFDIYGTLLAAAAGGVKPDPFADPVLRDILRRHGHSTPESPSTELHAAVLRHHAAAAVEFPEVDLRRLWREILGLDEGVDVTALVIELEEAWHPAAPIAGAAQAVRRLSRAGVSLGLLSNAQCNTMRSLGNIADLFAPELTILSYQHGVAKPSSELFDLLADRLAGRGIRPAETLFVGNDPLLDIVPAQARGFMTALFTGHPESIRAGECAPDFEIGQWSEMDASGLPKTRGDSQFPRSSEDRWMQ